MAAQVIFFDDATQPWRYKFATDTVRAGPFDAIELELTAFWIRLPEVDLTLSANKGGHNDD
jgi:hypothetical protein